LGRLTAVATGLSDPHRHGQTVCRLTFESGTQVIYKPRSLAVDALFNGLVDWWNQRQPHLPLRPVKLLQRRDFGWCECVQRRDCQTGEEVARYYRRQGVHLALFYMLGGTDFHHENFIPSGEWPVPIDLEALLALGIFDPYPPVGPAPPCLQPLSTSVMSTLMLPAWQSGSHDRPLAYISGIDGGGDRVTPVPRPCWTHLGTDQLQLVREFRVPDTSGSRPRLCGEPVSVEPHLPGVIQGFMLAYRTVQDSRESLLAADGPLRPFGSAQNRRIMRATRQYVDLLFWSTSPDLLTSGTARDIAIERLLEHPLGPLFEEAPIVAEEKRSLWEGDIPIFYNRPNSRRLRSSAGATFGSLVERTPFSLMKQRLAGFCEADMNWQIELIRCSLGMTFAPAHPTPAILSHPPEPSDTNPISAQTIFLRHAVELGEALERLAVRDEHGCRWLTLRRPPSYASEVFYEVTDPWLYAGTAGAGLFLANLSAVTCQPRFAELAQAALNFADWHHRILMDHPVVSRLTLSGYCGQGSLIYAFVESARLLNDGRWLDRAMQLRTAISKERIEKEENPDVVGGLAGLLWALLHLYKTAPGSEILADMIAVGHRLVALQGTGENAGGWRVPGIDKALLGMGHGAAGIVNALVRLHAVTGLETYRRSAQKGLQFERLHFSPAHGDWPDLQHYSAEPSFMAGWCAGAAGAGLARLGLKSAWPDDGLLDQEIECAVAATIGRLGGDTHHLCCGESGRILFLMEAAARFQNPSLAAIAIEAGLSMAGFFEAQGFWRMQSCSERSILPELMGGISGIGLTFLTLAAPEQRSKVLTLE
jgi:type 2 lantibiotic biosynthesis protein LanM